jgi:hypothetical protein
MMEAKNFVTVLASAAKSQVSGKKNYGGECI